MHDKSYKYTNYFNNNNIMPDFFRKYGDNKPGEAKEGRGNHHHNLKHSSSYVTARLYGVETNRLKEQVRRNNDRFPGDFMFVLNNEELNNLRSQIATSN